MSAYEAVRLSCRTCGGVHVVALPDDPAVHADVGAFVDAHAAAAHRRGCAGGATWVEFVPLPPPAAPAGSAPALEHVLEHAHAVRLHRLARAVVTGGVPVAQVRAWVDQLASLADGIRAAVLYAGSDGPLDFLDELLVRQLVSELEQQGRLHGGTRLAAMLAELATRVDRWCDQAPSRAAEPEAR